MRWPSARRATRWNAADWRGAAGLAVRPSKFAYADAMTYSRALAGATRSGDVGAARLEIAEIADMREKLRAVYDAYWTK